MFPSDFTLLTDAGEPLTLSSLRGRTVILYFYPKDDTSGCTLESCELRDLFPRFTASDAVVLGVSPDSVTSHQKFRRKYGLPFTLLVDENHALAERLGIWVEKTFYGQKYMGVQRTTYIIGPDSAVQHVFEKVNPAGHANEVMAFLTGGIEAAHTARADYDALAAAVKQSATATTSKPAGSAAKKKPAKRSLKRAVRKLVKKAVKKIVRKAVKKAGKKLVKKVAKHPAKKTVTRATKKPARRPASKK